MAVKLERMGHVNLTVRDVERSISFYTLLGFELVEQDEDHAAGCFMALPGDGHTVDLGPLANPDSTGVPPRGRDKVGVMHMAFRVSSYEDLQEACETLAANDVNVDRMTDHVSQRSIYFDDPDGNGLEIYYEYPTAKMLIAMGRGDRDEPFRIGDPLPSHAFYDGAAANPGAWRQG